MTVWCSPRRCCPWTLGNMHKLCFPFFFPQISDLTSHTFTESMCRDSVHLSLIVQSLSSGNERCFRSIMLLLERESWDAELVDFYPTSSKKFLFFYQSITLSIGWSYFSVNMNPMKLINMDESMKGMTCSSCCWMLLVLLMLWIILKVTSLWSFSFSRRLKVFKGLKVDTVLRNFTVFEYTENKVSDIIFHLNICESSMWSHILCSLKHGYNLTVKSDLFLQCFAWRKKSGMSTGFNLIFAKH